MPLIFGGKVYNSLKAIMTFKIVVVFGFLLLVAVLYSTPKRGSRSSPASSNSAACRSSSDAGAAREPTTCSSPGGKGAVADIDFSMIAVLGALAAISGNGGLTNTALSGYVRDQGWGMGKHVGAIPSVIGGQKIDAVPRRMVFPITANRSAASAVGIGFCCAIS